jgi:hypothetical protein
MSFCNISFVKHCPEDGHKRLPKNVRILLCLECNKFTYFHINVWSYSHSKFRICYLGERVFKMPKIIQSMYNTWLDCDSIHAQ